MLSKNLVLSSNFTQLASLAVANHDSDKHYKGERGFEIVESLINKGSLSMEVEGDVKHDFI